MLLKNNSFENLVNSVYNLSIEEKVELIQLLENNLADTRREEILRNYKSAKKAEKSKKIIYSSDINKLKKLL
jgi:hypothetical protein